MSSELANLVDDDAKLSFHGDKRKESKISNGKIQVSWLWSSKAIFEGTDFHLCDVVKLGTFSWMLSYIFCYFLSIVTFQKRRCAIRYYVHSLSLTWLDFQHICGNCRWRGRSFWNLNIIRAPVEFSSDNCQTFHVLYTTTKMLMPAYSMTNFSEVTKILSP